MNGVSKKGSSAGTNGSLFARCDISVSKSFYPFEGQLGSFIKALLPAIHPEKTNSLQIRDNNIFRKVAIPPQPNHAMFHVISAKFVSVHVALDAGLLQKVFGFIWISFVVGSLKSGAQVFLAG